MAYEQFEEQQSSNQRDSDEAVQQLHAELESARQDRSAAMEKLSQCEDSYAQDISEVIDYENRVHAYEQGDMRYRVRVEEFEKNVANYRDESLFHQENREKEYQIFVKNAEGREASLRRELESVRSQAQSGSESKTEIIRRLELVVDSLYKDLVLAKQQMIQLEAQYKNREDQLSGSLQVAQEQLDQSRFDFQQLQTAYKGLVQLRESESKNAQEQLEVLMNDKTAAIYDRVSQEFEERLSIIRAGNEEELRSTLKAYEDEFEQFEKTIANLNDVIRKMNPTTCFNCYPHVWDGWEPDTQYRCQMCYQNYGSSWWEDDYQSANDGGDAQDTGTNKPVHQVRMCRTEGCGKSALEDIPYCSWECARANMQNNAAAGMGMPGDGGQGPNPTSQGQPSQSSSSSRQPGVPAGDARRVASGAPGGGDDGGDGDPGGGDDGNEEGEGDYDEEEESESETQSETDSLDEEENQYGRNAHKMTPKQKAKAKARIAAYLGQPVEPEAQPQKASMSTAEADFYAAACEAEMDTRTRSAPARGRSRSSGSNT